MFRFLAGTAALAAAIPSGGYDKGHDSRNGKHDDGNGKSYGKHDDGYGNSSGHYGKRHHSKRHSDVHFPKAYAIIDPDYYNTVFTGYQTCVATKCDSLPNAYSSSGLSDCISTVASYTSCVTACAGAQAFETVENFRTLLDDVLVIGHDQLRKARLYLSGLGNLDVVGERVHIGDSCCLPNSYFAAWERILVPVEIPDLKVDNDSSDGYKKFKKHGYKKKKRSSKRKYRVLVEGDDGDATADDKQVDENTDPEETEHHDDDKDDEASDDKDDEASDDKDDEASDDKEAKYEYKKEAKYDDKKEAKCDDKKEAKYEYKKEAKYDDKKEAKYDDKKEAKYDDKKEAKYEDKKEAKYDDKKEAKYDDKKGDGYDEASKDAGYEDKPARVYDEGKADTPTAKYMISAADYVKQCLPSESKTNKVEWLNHIKCDTKLAEYLQFLQRNLGHLILAPTCKDLAPDGACCGDDVKQSNPRAVTFHDDVCVATKSEKNGKHKTLTNALVKPVDHDNYRDPCPCDSLDHEGSHATILYKRIKQRNLKYYSVASGLPSAVSVTDHVASCEYDFGLVRDDDDSASSYGDDSFFRPAPAPVNWDAALEAVRACPTDGLLEYCNVDQYATYLEYQLFDHASCDISELRLQNTDKPASYKTIACLYKIFTLKCDCMEAVLNCYVLTPPKFASALSKVIGQAASILCGFILCQRPSVYALFGEQYAVGHATLFRELLSAAGVLDGAATTPAMTVFASFALGMVALVVAKKVRAAHDTKTIDVDEGYQNLI